MNVIAQLEIHTLTGDGDTKKVMLDGVELRPERSQGVTNHSPDGFMWGYAGSGPAQLALAVMLELTHSDKAALELYQDFKFKVIAKLAIDEHFTIHIDPVTFERII